MRRSAPQPLLSVVVPTHNRASLLGDALDSLVAQTLPATDFEVLVIDDGSTDDTPEVCGRFAALLPLRTFRIAHSGIAAAKNIGIFCASGAILFFFDDDDVAHAGLLRQHVAAHARWPEEAAAVLGYTTWAPWLEVTPLMHYVTDVGQYLFSYRSVPTGRPLDFTYFWGGRSSCKRSFLARHGTFRQDFDFGCEDIELGYRLSRFGLQVHFDRTAVSFMNRGITLEDFCRRCERQGRAQRIFSDLHRDRIVQEYCQTADALSRWRSAQPHVPQAMARARELERTLEGVALDDAALGELWSVYDFLFTAFKLKGIVGAPPAQEPATPVAEHDDDARGVVEAW